MAILYSTVVHESMIHLFENLVAISLFGLILEKRIPRRWLIVVVILSATISKVTIPLFYPEEVRVRGISDVKYGVIGLFATYELLKSSEQTTVPSLNPSHLSYLNRLRVGFLLILLLFCYAYPLTFILFGVDTNPLYPYGSVAHTTHLVGTNVGVVCGVVAVVRN